MKKHLFILICAAWFFIPAAIAQKGFHIGVNGAAINTYLVDSKLYGDVDYAPNFTVGSLFGASVGNNFTNQFGFEMEVNYARLGQKYEYNDSLNQSPSITRTTGKVTLDYIQVPVMLKITGGDFKTRFSAMMGPQFSFLANAWNRKPDNSGVKEAKNDFNGSDIGLLLQFGTDISLTDDLYLNLGLRMYYGFVQANDNLQVISPSPFYMSKQTEDHLLNAYGGINVGLHYIFRNNENPKNQ